MPDPGSGVGVAKVGTQLFQDLGPAELTAGLGTNNLAQAPGAGKSISHSEQERIRKVRSLID